MMHNGIYYICDNCGKLCDNYKITIPYFEYDNQQFNVNNELHFCSTECIKECIRGRIRTYVMEKRK